MMKSTLFIILIFLLSTGLINAQLEDFGDLPCQKKSLNHIDDHSRYSILNENIDLGHFTFHLYIDPAVYQIRGSVDASFKSLENGLDKIVLELSNQLTVDSIIYDDMKLNNFNFISDYELNIPLPQVIDVDQTKTISIYYHGAPPSGGFGSFIQSSHNGIPIIWTLSEPYGSRDWWPCKNGLTDKLDSLDMYITTPSSYRAASNGVLMSEVVSDSVTTFHWKHNYMIAPYLVAFAVTDYLQYQDDVLLSNEVLLPMVNYVYPENEEAARLGTGKLVQVLQFYDSLFVNYPFYKEKYGHAQFGWGGGMEHQTMSFVVGYNWTLLSHELAHQWFGDMVTCGSWEHIWLNEGFATYLEGLTRERFPAQADYNFIVWKQNKVNQIVSQNGGSVFVKDTTNVGSIFNSRLSYSKGAYLLHMLRWTLGDENFFLGVRNYLEDVKFDFALTSDLQNHLENVSGLNLEEFFNDWFYGEGFPSYHIEWNYIDGELILLVIQTSSDPSVSFFEMDLPIRIVGSTLDTIIRINNSYNGQYYTIPLSVEPSQLVFDPDLWLVSSNNSVIHNDILTDINSVLPYAYIEIFPNPVQDYIEINGDIKNDVITYTIMNNIGQRIITNRIPSDKRIALAGLEKGIYTLTLYNRNGHIKTSRFFVKL